MIPVTTIYDDITENGGQYEWRIDNGTYFEKENIIGGTISSALYNKFSVGNCISSALELDLWGVGNSVGPGAPIYVQFRAADGGNASEWITRGTFYIDTIETSQYSEICHITAYDAMLKTETTYMASGVWVGSNTFDVLQQIANDIGVSLESVTYSRIRSAQIPMTAAPHIGTNGTTDREMLSAIGILHGCNFFINYQNKLQAIWPNDTVYNIADIGNAVATFDTPNSIEPITKVIVRKDDGTVYRKPDNISDAAFEALDGDCLDLTCPIYASQTVADNLYTLFRNKTFQPYTANEAYIDPKYTIGDGVTIKGTSLVLANQSLRIDPLASSDLEVDSLNLIQSHYPKLPPRERTTLYQIGQAATAAATAAAAVNGANYHEQVIYKSAVSGTNTMSPNTTWVTDTTGSQNTWTAVRPVYSSAYPVLFVATQRQSVEQSSGTTCSCTTPVKDQTTTVIDGGHITTGTIDASQVTVTNIDASNISTGTLSADRIAAGTIAVSQFTNGAQAALMTSSSSKTQYYLSTSASSATGGSWSDTVPTWTSGKYVWTRVSTTKTYANNTSSTTTSTAVYDANLTSALSTAASASSAASAAQSTADTALSSIGANLSPYFNNSFEDVYNATSNPTGYWRSRPSSYLTRLEDGWAQISCDNSSGTGTIWPTYYNVANTDLADANYTMLVELKDVSVTGSVYIWNSNTNGGQIPQYRSDTHTVTGNGSFYLNLIKTNNANPTNFTRSGFGVGAGEKISCKVRISVYKSGYQGAYVPYVSNDANNSAVYREQIIYISKASGTASVSANTTWVTTSSNSQNTWTTTRPVYNSSYPVLFVATQTQTMLYKGSTTCTCTTPVIDQTTTVIDGGHITTGSIDAGRITVGTLSGITISGNTITGGTLTNATSSGSVRIADGSIDFFKNATTTGTPFSKIKHVTDSAQGDSIEWTNTGYTKLVNTGGGQWTGDFLQFALNASSPSLKFLIYNDDTGAVIEARNSYKFYVNGAQIYANKAGAGDNAAIRVANGTASTDTSIFLKRTDIDRSLELLIGSGGKNRGLYARDANMTGWLLYYDDTNINITKPLKLSTALGVGYGGTGATTAAAARSNLGMTTVSLWSGTLSTTATTISSAYGAYSAYIFVGKPSGGAQASMVIPKAAVTTSDVTWQLTDNTNYRTFKIHYSGTSIIITGVAGSGSVTNVYGIAGA